MSSRPGYEKYTYDGPVMEFDRCIAHSWKASTYAPSERKARSNLIFQFKRENNRLPNTRIDLPGKLVKVERKETA